MNTAYRKTSCIEINPKERLAVSEPPVPLRATGTDDERAAVDEILGPPTTGWPGGERDERSGRQSDEQGVRHDRRAEA